MTLRIPAELNEWLNEYRHLSYPRRIEKQSLVIEALRLLYIARGQPGNDPYHILGVKRGVTSSDLNARYRQLLRVNHPDKVAQLDPQDSGIC